MSKIYLVDSKNVGDRWIDILNENEYEKFVVFYTGHSPRIDYEHAISLMNVNIKPEFIHCYEGSNALGFQLVTYLGYLPRAEESKEMIVISNDTGFDAVINFWTERGMNISRLAIRANHAEETEIPDETVPLTEELFSHTFTAESIFAISLKASISSLPMQQNCPSTHRAGL